ncbi:MAG: Penicillin-binding protein activator LpoA [SAR116 cluster bacterium]|nr:MAG: Penicillin-binding protein activator LpoA [SAR116 cluster bacterium]
MPSFSRHSGFAAALMFLSACGVAVEKAPQTASPRTVTDKTITETASAPEIPTSTETEISAAQAGNSADNSAPDIAQAEGQTIDDIIASLEAPDDDTSPVGDLFAGQGTDPDKAVSGDAENTDAADADMSVGEKDSGLSGTETILALLAPAIADAARRTAPETAEQPEADNTSRAAAAGDTAGDTSGDTAEDVIWNIETAQKKRVTPPEAVAPTGPDASLASDALEAAFAMIANRNPPMISEEFRLPTKLSAVTRVGLLIPKTGPNSRLGTELLRGAELALFAMRDPSIELLSFDTAGGPAAAMAARQAMAADVDIVVGPLFSQSVIAARSIIGQRGVPMLALSNNLQIADQASWLLGYMPEQQIELLLGHALTVGHSKIAILVEESPFGQRLAAHTVQRLQQFGLTPEVMQTLTQAQLAADDQLKTAIREFTGYVPLEEDEEAPAFADLPPPRFDAVVFAGGAEFALRTAPVLAYYDADSERVLYLGNAQWNQRRLLMEPSLYGALFASRPTGQDDRFNTLWADIWESRPGTLARLSFDAMAMISVVARNKPPRWRAALVSDSGFNGFSGAYRLYPDGSNRRAFELRQIGSGVSTLFRSAPDKL